MVTHGGPDPRTALWRSRAGRESTLESLSVDNVRFLMHRRLLRPGPRLDSARHPLRSTGAQVDSRSARRRVTEPRASRASSDGPPLILALKLLLLLRRLARLVPDRERPCGLIGRHAGKRMAAVHRGCLDGFVDVVDREGDAVHADLAGSRGLRRDRVGVNVPEEPEAVVASGVWSSAILACLPSRPTAVTIPPVLGAGEGVERPSVCHRRHFTRESDYHWQCHASLARYAYVDTLAMTSVVCREAIAVRCRPSPRRPAIPAGSRPEARKAALDGKLGGEIDRQPRGQSREVDPDAAQ